MSINHYSTHLQITLLSIDTIERVRIEQRYVYERYADSPIQILIPAALVNQSNNRRRIYSRAVTNKLSAAFNVHNEIKFLTSNQWPTQRTNERTNKYATNPRTHIYKYMHWQYQSGTHSSLLPHPHRARILNSLNLKYVCVCACVENLQKIIFVVALSFKFPAWHNINISLACWGCA